MTSDGGEKGDRRLGDRPSPLLRGVLLQEAAVKVYLLGRVEASRGLFCREFGVRQEPPAIIQHFIHIVLAISSTDSWIARRSYYYGTLRCTLFLS